MMPADLERLHEYMLEVEGITEISDEIRAVVEELWPELAHKLPPKGPSRHKARKEATTSPRLAFIWPSQ